MSDPNKPKKNPGRVLPQRWAKGQSGNPKGRPRGSTKKEIIRKAIETTVEKIGVDVESGKILRHFGKQIISEICRIALSPDVRVVRKGVAVMQPSESKVKCLIACMDRLVPALKTVAIRDDGEHLDPKRMTDLEIIQLMNKMVNMAQGGASDEWDG